MKRIVFYGGSFDPPHDGHLTIAKKLTEVFRLDEFYFVPAFHAPHKKSKSVTSPFCRYAMLALATNDAPQLKISTIELDAPEKPYTFETQTKLKARYKDSAQIFFVMGADSWNEIDTWREWEKVLTLTNIIVVTRPDYELNFSHVTESIRQKIVDLRDTNERRTMDDEQKIYLTDAVFLDVSATEIRQNVRDRKDDWRARVPATVADYIEKYRLYLK